MGFNSAFKGLIQLGLILLPNAVGQMDYLSYQFENCKNI
jgi:hypothetical protein